MLRPNCTKEKPANKLLIFVSRFYMCVYLNSVVCSEKLSFYDRSDFL